MGRYRRQGLAIVRLRNWPARNDCDGTYPRTDIRGRVQKKGRTWEPGGGCSQIDRRRAKFALLVFSITRRPLPSSKVIARRTRWMEDRTGTDRTGTDIRRKGHQTGSMREGGGYPCRRAQGGAAHGSPARGRFSRILSGWRRGPPGYRRLSRERRRRLWSLPGQQQGVPLASVECVTTSGGNDR